MEKAGEITRDGNALRLAASRRSKRRPADR
jgi:hypothetical protein